MAEIRIPGPISGQNYGFRIAGDAPTADEQRRIDSIIRQQEAAFGRQYSDQFGAAPAGIEGSGILDYAGELPKGALRGLGNFAETAGLGLAALLPEGLETPTREGIKKVSRWAQSGIQPDIGFEGNKSAEVIGRLGEGLGSFGALAATSLVPGGLFLAPGLATASGAGEASERARAAGATQEQRNMAAMLGAPVGLTEMVPLKALERTLGGEFTGQLLSRLRRIFAQGGIEGAQEAAAEAAQNLIQREIYDPERGVFTDTGEAFGYGAGVGAIVQGLLDLALPRSRGGAAPATPQEAPPAATPAPAAEQLMLPPPSAQEMPGIAGLLPPPDLMLPSPDTIGQRMSNLTPDVVVTPPPALGEARRRAEPEPEAPAAETPTPPAETKKADPVTRGQLTRILDDLGVPKTAAVYRAASSGAIADETALDARLAKFAAATSSKNETRTAQGRVRARLQNAPEARTVVTEETPDVADVAAPTDVVALAPGAGAGAEGGGGSPAPRPPRSRRAPKPAAPAVADVGRPPADIPAPAVAEAEQPAPVAPPAPELVAAPEPTPSAAGPAAVTPTSPAAPPVTTSAPYTPMSGAIPGAVSGAPGQVIPPPAVAPTPAPAAPTAPLGQATVDTIRAQRDAVVEEQADAAAQEQLQVRFETEAPKPLQDNWRAIAQDYDTAPTTSSDKQKVLALLRKGTPARVGKKITAEKAAQVYFSKAPDPGHALHMIAYDAAQAPKDRKDRDPDFRKRSDLIPEGFENDADVLQNYAYFEGTGVEVAQRAAQWVKNNLSPETVRELNKLTKQTYRERDYRLESESRDKKKEQTAYEQQWLKDSGYDVTPDTDTASDLGFGTEDLGGLDLASFSGPPPVVGHRVHPRVEDLLRRGNLVGALHALSVTARTPQERKLALKLMSRTDGVPSRVMAREDFAQVMTTLDPETSDADVTRGLYIHPATPAQLAAYRKEGRPEYADFVQGVENTVLFADDVPLTAELVLHEAAHAASHRVLNNPSHPFTRQLERMRSEMLKFMPATTYGLTNVHELMSEGMANPDFRRDLSYVNLEGKPFSAWQQFKSIIGNWLRGLIGRPPKQPDSARDELDRILDRIISLDPEEAGGGDVVASSFSASKAKAALDDVKDRVRVPTKDDMKRFETVMRARGIPNSWKGTLARLAMPLDYAADAAAKYLPTSRTVHDLVMQHQAEIQRAASKVSQSVEQIATVLAKYKKQQDLIDAFNRVRLTGSQMEVDVRKPRSAYEGYSFRYNVLDADGNIIDSKSSKRFADESDRNRAMQAYNSTLPEGAPAAARARRSFDMDPEVLADYDRLRPLYDKMPEDMREALDRTFSMPVTIGKDLGEAIRARIESLVPNQRALQEKIYGVIYQKILKGQMIDPYQPLRREGQFWLQYTALDPETGQLDTFKHSFHTTQQRDFAISRLEALGPEAQVSGVTAYENIGSGRARPTVPMEFVAKVLDSIEGAEGLAGDVKGQIIELMFDTAPETSFINAYRRREGVSGFDGDVTPITETFAAGDTLKNIRESNLRIARQVADLKYGAKFAAARNKMEEEYNTFANRPRGGQSELERAQENDAAANYFEMLRDYTFVPFKQRGALSRNLTGGAYMLTLGFNLSTAMITMSQVPLFVAPFLAGKHGLRQTIAAIGAAHRALTGAGRERTVERIAPDGTVETVRTPVRFYDFSIDNYDFDDPSSPNAYLKPLHDVAKANGVFNRSLLQDELLGEQPTMFQRIAAASGVVQHHAERYSREVALGAAYHLELMSQMGARNSVADFISGLQDGSIKPTASQARAAAEAAVNTSEKTNGPIYAAAGPLASQSDLGAVLYLFKRHPLAMMNLMWQTTQRSFGSNPEDRKMAQRQLAGMMGAMATMSGVLGLPMIQQIGWLYDMFADDDEPDFETVVRTTLGEQGAHGLVDFLTGMRISERIGLSGAFYRPGFASDQLPVPYQILEGVGGPVVGLGLKYLDRAPKLFAEGEFQRGFESIAPTAIANMMRSVRFADEGIRTMRYDPIIDDIGPFSVAAQALGFMPAQYAQQLAQNAVGTRINNAIDTKKSRLLQKRYIAMRQGDYDTVRDIDTQIKEFNQRHPRNAITPDTIERSMTSHQRTTARTHHGVSYSAGNEAYLRELNEQWGPSSLWE